MPAINVTKPSSSAKTASSTCTTSLHPFRICDDEEVEPEMLCPICHDAIDHPIELTPCGDMFCLACLEQHGASSEESSSRAAVGSSRVTEGASSSLATSRLACRTCPQCHVPVQEERVPTRVLLNLLLNVRVRCTECGWEGTREVSAQHSCCDLVAEANAALKAAYTLKRDSIALQQKKSDLSSAGPAAPSSPQRASASETMGCGPAAAAPTAPASSAASQGHVQSGSNNVNNNNTTASSSSNSAAPLPQVRRANDTSESALLRNFQTIEDDPNFSTIRRQRVSSSGANGFGGNGNGGGGGGHQVSSSLENFLVPPGSCVAGPSTATQPNSAVSRASGPGSPSEGGYYGLGYYPESNSSVPTSHLAATATTATTSNDAPALVISSPTPVPVNAAAPMAIPVNANALAAVAMPQHRPGSAEYGRSSSSGLLGARSSSSSLPLPPVEGCWQRYGMTQAEYDQVMGIFLSFDTDGTGRLDRRQMFQLCVCLNYVSTKEDLNFFFDEMDPQCTGYVTLDQFCLWLRENRPSPDALYGLTPFEYNDAMIQFRVADPSYRGSTEQRDFCQLCLRNGYARTMAEAEVLFHRCADPATRTVNLHRYFKLLQSLKQQGFAMGARHTSVSNSSSSNNNNVMGVVGAPRAGGSGSSATGGASSPYSGGSSLAAPPVGIVHGRRASSGSNDGHSAHSQRTAGAAAAAAATGPTIPRPPPRSSPVTGHVITGGRSSNASSQQQQLHAGGGGQLPRLMSDASSSFDRLGSTLNGTTISGSSLDGSMIVASGGRATTGATGSSSHRGVSSQKGKGHNKDCVIM